MTRSNSTDPEQVSQPRVRKRRRVTTDSPAGSDPTPAPEPDRLDPAENDARLRDDKPPHY